MTISEQAKKRAAELANIVAAEKGNRQDWRSTDTGFDTLDALARFIQETSDACKAYYTSLGLYPPCKFPYSDEASAVLALILPDDELSVPDHVEEACKVAYVRAGVEGQAGARHFVNEIAKRGLKIVKAEP